jgi:23S rRNA pseudouridine1911/1915/1917 synthase
MDPVIIYEDDDILAVNKPAGLITHPVSETDASPSVAGWIRTQRPALDGVGEHPLRPGIVHRLDRDTSGVLLIAKNQRTFKFLKTLFQERKIQKTYLGIVRGPIPASGTIARPIGFRNGSVKRSVFSVRGAKEAVTRYTTLSYWRDGATGAQYALVQFRPETGRTHQIRVHAAAIGHSIVGDALYGGKGTSVLARRHLLHAETLEFTTEDGRVVRVSADAPDDFRQFLSGFIQESPPDAKRGG